ncbi:protein PIF-like [Patella vulgata]|uniref:protein PIF-like n=1 Tax=Patella vulgata TaxID=6465 RepID=UPI00217F4ED4|nr:protein PIF-like [Patella vulgata]
MKQLVLVGIVTLVALHTAVSYPTGCQRLLDVIAVVDGSDSVGPEDFQSVRNSLKRFVTALGVSSSVRFGVVVYSSAVGKVIPLSGDASNVTNEIGNLTHTRAGTATDLGIAKMIEMFNGSSSPKVGIVITDGASLTPSATRAQATNAKIQKINMFAIGVGDKINAVELSDIASSTNQVLSVTDYTALAQQITSLVLEICPTTQPTTTYPTTQPASTHPCDDCAMVNGIGYNPHEDCDKFIQCEFTTDLTLLRYHVKQCGYGTFWDQDKLICNHIGNVPCDNDPCSTRLDGYKYKTTGNCSQYYRCEDGETLVRHCQPGYFYDTTNSRCSEDPSCNYLKPLPPKCYYRERTGDKCHYDWVVGFQTYEDLPCPAGTTFNQARCVCDTEFGTFCSPPCKPIVDIDFNSDEPGEYDNYGATIRNGKAYFNGNAIIRILTLANVDFLSKVNIKVKYSQTSNSFETQAVVTNGDCGKQPSISIINQHTNVQFNLADTTNATHNLRVNSYVQAREVEYSLKDKEFTANVNSNTNSKWVADALILRSKCAFQLGHGTGSKNFTGWIDYITVSTC